MGCVQRGEACMELVSSYKHEQGADELCDAVEGYAGILIIALIETKKKCRKILTLMSKLLHCYLEKTRLGTDTSNKSRFVLFTGKTQHKNMESALIEFVKGAFRSVNLESRCFHPIHRAMRGPVRELALSHIGQSRPSVLLAFFFGAVCHWPRAFKEGMGLPGMAGWIPPM
mmetsp:Transcript_29881/g.62645  ORF Transcript_29881/g.62645 Transcript_29881/m.62645 type:complete len:171 (-) Transcript_29881:102-614(-)